MRLKQGLSCVEIYFVGSVGGNYNDRFAAWSISAQGSWTRVKSEK
jgi:hypothetical protein